MNEKKKCMENDVACNGLFICFQVTDNPPIKWQGSAWVLNKSAYHDHQNVGRGLFSDFK